MSIVDALFLPDELAGHVLLAIAFGVFAAIVGAVFSLGGAWALRGRAALTTPRCSRCGFSLRGAGTELPTNCPECGRSLRKAGSVRSLRYRRQALTVGITAPVVAIGGFAIGTVAAMWIVSVVRAAISDVTVGQSGTPIVSALQPKADAPGDIDLSEYRHRPARDLLAHFWPDVSSDVTALPSVVENYTAQCRRQRYTLPTANRLLDAVAMGAFTEAEVRRGRANQGAWRGSRLHLVAPLLQSGDASPAWYARLISPPEISQTIVPVAPESVQAGSTMTLRLVDIDPSCATRPPWTYRIHDVKATDAEGGVINAGRVTSSRSPGYSLRAPGVLGPMTISVTWSDAFYQTGGVVEAVVEVTTDVTRLRRHPAVEEPFVEMQLAVLPLAERDAITFEHVNSEGVALLGTWSVNIDGRWIPMMTERAHWASASGGVLAPAPKSSWKDRERVRVRFVPWADNEVDRLLPSLSTAAGGSVLARNASRVAEPFELELATLDLMSQDGALLFATPTR